MIPITKITLTRVEGPPKECVTKHATTFTHANIILTAWSHSAPKDGGYDKIDFTVQYQDGETYCGRYDLIHWEGGEPDLQAQVDHALHAYAGLRKPPWVETERYTRFLRRLGEDVITRFRHFLENHEI